MKTQHFHSVHTPGADCAAVAPLLPVLAEESAEVREEITSVQEHLAACGYCRDQLAGYDQLDAALRRYLGPAAIPRLAVADIVGGFAPASRQATQALAANTGNELPAPVIGSDAPSEDQGPLDRRPFQPDQPRAIPHPILAFRARWTFTRRLSAIAAALLLAALIGSLAAGLILVRQHRSSGQTAAAQQNIYITASGGDTTGNSWVYKLNAQTHALQWKTSILGQILGRATVVDGTVYVSTDVGAIYALNASDGAVRWGSPPTPPSLVPPSASAGMLVIGDGAVYISGPGYTVYAYRAATGALLWRKTVAAGACPSTSASNALVDLTYGDRPSTVPYCGALVGLTYGDGALYGSEVSHNGKERSLFALNAATGALLWRTPAPENRLFGPPQFANGKLFAALQLLSLFVYDIDSPLPHDAIAAYDAKTGAQLWRSQPVIENEYIPPVVAHGILYVAGTDAAKSTGYIYALNEANGTVSWRYHTEAGEAFYSSPEVADGVLYISGKSSLNRNFVLARNASDGAERWRYRSLFLDDSLAVQDGVLYISLETGVLYALRAANGAELWHLSYVKGFIYYNSAQVTVAP